jgi:hypothetical protein
MSSVLVHLGYHSKIPWTRWLKQQIFLYYSSGAWEVKVPTMKFLIVFSSSIFDGHFLTVSSHDREIWFLFFFLFKGNKHWIHSILHVNMVVTDTCDSFAKQSWYSYFFKWFPQLPPFWNWVALQFLELAKMHIHLPTHVNTHTHTHFYCKHWSLQLFSQLFFVEIDGEK